jgi:ribosomal protein L37E
MTAAPIEQWIAYAVKMECKRCGERIFGDEYEAREAAEALIEAGYGEPPVLREYHSLCDHYE